MNIHLQFLRVLRAAALIWLAIGAIGAVQGQTAVVPDSALAAAIALARDSAAIGAPAGARIEVQAGSLDSRLRLAACARIEPYLAAGNRPWGRTRVGLRCTQGATPWNITLPLTVRVFAPSLVGSLALPAGTKLEADHLRMAEVDWAAEASPVQTNADKAIGRVLSRPLAAGQPLRASDLKPRQWFAAGDTVRIVAAGPGFSISAEGQALSNGIEGQSARVRTESGRTIVGMPSGEHCIEVAL